MPLTGIGLKQWESCKFFPENGMLFFVLSLFFYSVACWLALGHVSTRGVLSVFLMLSGLFAEDEPPAKKSR